MPNCFIYCRVSTEEQADKGYSLDAQEKLCRDFAERNGYRVANIYRDEGKSGTKLERPALTELISGCTKDGLIQAVIVQETDRLARNTKDHLTIKAVLQKAGVKVISVAQPMLDDSPEGNMIDTILASVNQFQSDINSRKTKRGLKEKFDQGWWPGWAPLGYTNAVEDVTSDAKPRATIVTDPSGWDLLKEGFHLYLTGDYSVDEVNDVLYDRGLRSKTGKKVAHSTIVRTLRNPFYAGIMRYGGVEKPGRHKPMITLAEHRRVLEIMDGHNYHVCRRRKHQFLLRGFVFCNICGHRYTAETRPAKRKDYYHCGSMRLHSSRGQNVEVATLERQVEDCFKTIQFSQEFTDLIIERLKTIYLRQRQTIGSQKQILQNRKMAVETKRDKAEEKLLDGVISDKDFLRLRRKFAEELASIQRQAEELDDQKELDMDVVQEVLRLCRDIYQGYKHAPYALKRQYLNIFWDRFLVQNKKIVAAIPTELVAALLREEKVRLRTDWRPSPLLIRTLMNVEYMGRLKEKLEGLSAILAGEEGIERKAA